MGGGGLSAQIAKHGIAPLFTFKSIFVYLCSGSHSFSVFGSNKLRKISNYYKKL